MDWVIGIGGTLAVLYGAAGIACTDWFAQIVIRAMDNANWE